MNEKLREIREQHGMTQEELGLKIGKTKQWLSELERGNIRLTYEMAIQIAQIFGGTPDLFLPNKSNLNGLESKQDNHHAV